MAAETVDADVETPGCLKKFFKGLITRNENGYAAALEEKIKKPVIQHIEQPVGDWSSRAAVIRVFCELRGDDPHQIERILEHRRHEHQYIEQRQTQITQRQNHCAEFLQIHALKHIYKPDGAMFRRCLRYLRELGCVATDEVVDAGQALRAASAALDAEVDRVLAAEAALEGDNAV